MSNTSSKNADDHYFGRGAGRQLPFNIALLTVVSSLTLLYSTHLMPVASYYLHHFTIKETGGLERWADMSHC